MRRMLRSLVGTSCTTSRLTSGLSAWWESCSGGVCCCVGGGVSGNMQMRGTRSLIRARMSGLRWLGWLGGGPMRDWGQDERGHSQVVQRITEVQITKGVNSGLLSLFILHTRCVVVFVAKRI